ncbi:MAG: hypothetical protein V7K82_25250 [Nostoc sp.]
MLVTRRRKSAMSRGAAISRAKASPVRRLLLRSLPCDRLFRS